MTTFVILLYLIDFWLIKDKWVNISSQDWVFDMYGGDSISVSTGYFSEIGFEGKQNLDDLQRFVVVVVVE